MSTQPKIRIAALAMSLLISLPSLALAASSSANRGYLGKPQDPGFGFQDLKNRWYDPGTQRFLSIDPVFWEVGRVPKQPGGQIPDWQKALRSSQAQNPTGYASGNPIRYSDPDGRWFKEFASGRQPWAEFQLELGEAAERLAQDSAYWSWAMEHPAEAGLATGVAAGVAFAVAALTVTALVDALAPAAGDALVKVGIAGQAAAKAQQVVGKMLANGLHVGQNFGKLGTVLEIAGAKIVSFSGHAIEQVITRGLSPQVLRDTVAKPLVTLRQSGGQILYLTRQAGVVMNSSGQVITVYSQSDFKQHVIDLLNQVSQ